MIFTSIYIPLNRKGKKIFFSVSFVKINHFFLNKKINKISNERGSENPWNSLITTRLISDRPGIFSTKQLNK